MEHDNNEDYEFEGIFNEESISPDRLCEAADAIIEALKHMEHPVNDTKGLESLEWPAHSEPEAALEAYSRSEIAEAAAFLRRLGVINDESP